MNQLRKSHIDDINDDSNSNEKVNEEDYERSIKSNDAFDFAVFTNILNKIRTPSIDKETSIIDNPLLNQVSLFIFYIIIIF